MSTIYFYDDDGVIMMMMVTVTLKAAAVQRQTNDVYDLGTVKTNVTRVACSMSTVSYRVLIRGIKSDATCLMIKKWFSSLDHGALYLTRDKRSVKLFERYHQLVFG